MELSQMNRTQRRKWERSVRRETNKIYSQQQYILKNCRPEVQAEIAKALQIQENLLQYKEELGFIPPDPRTRLFCCMDWNGQWNMPKKLGCANLSNKEE